MSKYSRTKSISKISKKSRKLTRRGTVTVDPHESFIKYAAGRYFKINLILYRI